MKRGRRTGRPRCRGRWTSPSTRAAPGASWAIARGRWTRPSAKAGARRCYNSRSPATFMSEQETLEDHLRRATRNFSARLPEDAALTLGRDLARELQRAHSESPARFPQIEPTKVTMVDGKPVLAGAQPGGDVGEDRFPLGGVPR